MVPEDQLACRRVDRAGRDPGDDTGRTRPPPAAVAAPPPTSRRSRTCRASPGPGGFAPRSSDVRLVAEVSVRGEPLRPRRGARSTVAKLEVTRLLQNPLGDLAPEGERGDIVRISDGRGLPSGRRLLGRSEVRPGRSGVRHPPVVVHGRSGTRRGTPSLEAVRRRARRAVGRLAQVPALPAAPRVAGTAVQVRRPPAGPAARVPSGQENMERQEASRHGHVQVPASHQAEPPYVARDRRPRRRLRTPLPSGPQVTSS